MLILLGWDFAPCGVGAVEAQQGAPCPLPQSCAVDVPAQLRKARGGTIERARIGFRLDPERTPSTCRLKIWIISWLLRCPIPRGVQRNSPTREFAPLL